MYDVVKVLTNLNERHDNAIAVFGIAQCALQYAQGSTLNLDEFIKFLPYVARDAKFFRWHEGVVGALHRFCHICLVDPKLIEVYLGMSFKELITC